MLRSNWRIIIAGLGCVIASQIKAGAPTPKRGVAVASRPQAEAKAKEQLASKPTWPATIAAGEKASRADCGTAKECRAEQREYSDLRAQWEAANAAKSAERAGWWQTWIAAIGVALLIWTLWETRRIAKRQLRAYVHPGLVSTSLENEHWLFMHVPLTNSGQTPATKVHGRIEGFYVPYPLSRVMPEYGISTGIDWPMVGPGSERFLRGGVFLTAAQQNAVRSRTAAIVARIEISYCIFTGERITEPTVFMVAIGPGFSSNRMSVLAQHYYAKDGEEREDTTHAVPRQEEPELPLEG